MSSRFSTQVDSPFGPLELVADDRALLSITFTRTSTRSRSNPILERTQRALDRYFAKRFTRVELPLALSNVTPFRSKVLQTLWRHVPAGELVSYRTLARLCDAPLAARAVGGAMANNPWPILVPCHRVVAANGPGGFGPGLAMKRALLAHEGVELSF